MYEDLFDFRPSDVKRREFRRILDAHLRNLFVRFGHVCFLQFAPDCAIGSGVTVDHLIPLSSNRLNKRLRGMKTSRLPDGRLRKVPSQSFGSNDPRNLVLACKNCNSFKMDKLLNKERMRVALSRFRRVASV